MRKYHILMTNLIIHHPFRILKKFNYNYYKVVLSTAVWQVRLTKLDKTKIKTLCTLYLYTFVGFIISNFKIITINDTTILYGTVFGTGTGTGRRAGTGTGTATRTVTGPKMKRDQDWDRVQD